MIACDSNSGSSDTGDKTPPDNVSGNVSGVVQDAGTGTLLPNIAVTLNSVQTTTDSDGRFAFQDVAVGSKVLEATTTGYGTYTEEINVQSGTNNHDISLIRKAHYQFLSNWGDLDLYLPPSVFTFRGVIFLGEPSGQDARGFASGIPRTSAAPGLNEFVNAERARSLQLAEKHGLALMGSHNANRSRIEDTILAALQQFAGDGAHPELAQAPVLATGFSWGGCLAYEFAEYSPSVP